MNAGGLDRDVFLARVRDALGRGDSLAPPPAAPPTPPRIDEALVRLAGADKAIDLFVEKAEDVGGVVHRTTPAGLPAALASLAGSLALKTITMNLADDGAREELCATLADTGVTVVDWRATAGLEAHYDVDAGITDVAAAIAETGTLVIRSGPKHSRGTFIVPPIHIAIVRADDVVPDMIDYWRLEMDGDPAATVFVTGPSKTADIEGILITGVHGPGAVHVVLVAEADA